MKNEIFAYLHNDMNINNDLNFCTNVTQKHEKERKGLTLSLPIYWNDDNSKTCFICLQTQPQFVYHLPCGHFFHNECLNKSLLFSNLCPICKKPLPISTNNHTILYTDY